MRTLHTGIRVTDLQSSLRFYRALGYSVVGSVPETPLGHLTMLKLPADEFVSLELVAGATASVVPGGALSHLVVQVESLDAILTSLAACGVEPEHPVSPGGLSDPRTAWLADPDGNRIELVQWPPGHPAGVTATDFS